ncbi:ferredoxin [Streptomyces sp. NPDC051572]|uniref:ferredoxin n=1 Tax=unclassified Streptomyces TaxID=2593676 RepID=UPI00344CB2A9
MRVTVDQEMCVSAGQCATLAGKVFDQREEDGVVVLLDERPPADLEEAVRDAAAVCPVRAIGLTES